MGKKSSRKGRRVEVELVHLHESIGVACERVPLSGSAGGSFSGDLRLSISDMVLAGEVKARAAGDGFRTLERWLADNDILFLRRDRAEPLVLLPWRTWARLLRPARAQVLPMADPAG
jgi:Holliday junction resolvase